MALSLNPNQFKQAIHTSSLPNTSIQPFSTPRQLSTIVHSDHDQTKLSMGQTEPSAGFKHVTHNGDMNKLTPPSQAAPDLPSWTPLKAPAEDDEGSLASDPEVDELATRKAIGSPTKRHPSARPHGTNARRPFVQVPVPASRQTSSSSSITNPKPSAWKRARFDGVLITTKPPRYTKSTSSSRSSVQRGPLPASNALTFSLVDALARTFDANKHTEGHFRRPRDGASSGLHTDVETTEAEDERLQLNARLAHGLSKRQRTLPTTGRTLGRSANVSETTSEDATLPVGRWQDRDVPHHPAGASERAVAGKRLKPIQYEANAALIDAALGTVQAPISWDAEMDIITRGDDFIVPVQTAYIVDGHQAGDYPTNASSSSAPNPVGNEWYLPTRTGPKRAILSPYQSRGDKFRQRLDAMFGQNATVRTDRVARPRPVDLDFFTSLDEMGRESSPSVSESTESASSASPVEEVASAVPNTHITSRSPDNLPADVNMERLTGRVDEVGSWAAEGPTSGTNEEEMSAWIASLQRLVKGKVPVKEEELDMLSIILAEIESVKDNLDQSLPMTSELRESIKQLAVLYEIPFGDRNKLRQRAGRIFLSWPSTGKPGAS